MFPVVVNAVPFSQQPQPPSFIGPPKFKSKGLVFAISHLVVVAQVVTVHDALVAPDDVEEVVLGQEAAGHVRTEQAGKAAGIGETATSLLKMK